MSTLRRIIDIFEPRERWGLLGLGVVIVMVALLQTLGVASIMPFMGLVANPQMIGQDERIRWLYDAGGFESTRAFLLFSGLVVLGLMAFSNGAAACQHWLTLRFMWRKQHQLAVRLLDRYLGEPYTFYLDQNTAALAKNILAEVGEAITGVVTPVMTLIAQTFVIACVFGLLVFVDVTVALAAALLLGGGYGVIFTLIKRRQRRLGKARRAANGQRFKAAAEALGSIKETRVLGREAEFLRRFTVWNDRYSRANASNALVRDMPRFALETLAFGGVLVVVLHFLYTREDFGQAVAVMSLYALAGYRLMPALQHAFRALAQIRFFTPALESLHADLESVPPPGRPMAVAGPTDAPLRFDREIAFEGVAYTYPRTGVTVVRNIDLRIVKNTCVALVGSTGCGKTTLVDLLLGLLEPRHGRIRIDDTPVSAVNVAAWQKRVGYVPQHIFLCDDTVTRNIALGVPDDDVDPAAVERAARLARLHGFVVSLADGYGTLVGERGVRLSGGERQRIGIARALYHDPDVLIMDEATSALDGITEDAVIQAIRELAGQKTIVLVAHRLTTVRDCNAIHLVERGEIVASGTYRDLMQTNLTFRAMASGRADAAAVS